MLDPIAATPTTTRLRALLERCTSGLSDETVAEARSLGPDMAGDVVASLVEAELSRPTGGTTATRAVHLANELKLPSAIPALVRCVGVLPDVHPLRRAALAAMAGLGGQVLEALLCAFERCSTPEKRARVAEALSRTAVKDDRVRAAFVRMLDDDPINAARYLADGGEWRAVPALASAVDNLSRMPVGDCDVCAGQHLTRIASAVRVLGGTLSEERLVKIDEVLARRDAQWISFDDPLASPGASHPPVTGKPRRGRNAPCHCGSGKKYKKCHLEADERAGSSGSESATTTPDHEANRPLPPR